MNFPQNPTAGDTHEIDNKKWQFNGTAWDSIPRDNLYSSSTIPAEEAAIGSTWFSQDNGSLYYKDQSNMWVTVRGAF